MTRSEALRRVLYLKRLPDGAITLLAELGGERRLSRDEPLFVEGERPLGMLVVTRGAIRVSKCDTRGREMVLGVERAGASIGDLALFDGGTYPTDAHAAEDDTQVLVIPRVHFEALLMSHPEVAAEIIRTLAVESRKLIEMLKAQALHTVRARLAAYLLNAAGGELVFPLDETNAAIGSRVGTVREVISRTLHAMEDAGAIQLRGRTVTLLDRVTLERIANQDG
jgi:CRP/FNR family transcriptional regulator